MTRQPREPVMLVGAQEAPEPVTLRGIGSPSAAPMTRPPEPVMRCATRESLSRQAMIAAVYVMVSPSILSLAVLLEGAACAKL